jgi:hypothetical protein
MFSPLPTAAEASNQGRVAYWLTGHSGDIIYTRSNLYHGTRNNARPTGSRPAFGSWRATGAELWPVASKGYRFQRNSVLSLTAEIRRVAETRKVSAQIGYKIAFTCTSRAVKAKDEPSGLSFEMR